MKRLIPAGLFAMFVAFCIGGLIFDTGRRMGQDEPGMIAADNPVAAFTDDQRSALELRSQRDAANWSWWAVVIAAAQVPISAFGLLALLRSLGQTELSLKEARRSADFAGEGHHAFLRLEDAALVIAFDDGSMFAETASGQPTIRTYRFKVRVRNVGRSTALLDHLQIDDQDEVYFNSVAVVATGEAVTVGTVELIANGPGAAFEGVLGYSSQIRGKQEYAFGAIIMEDRSSEYRYHTAVYPRELPPRRTREAL